MFLFMLMFTNLFITGCFKGITYREKMIPFEAILNIQEEAIEGNLDKVSELIQGLTQGDLESVLAQLIVDEEINDNMITAVLARIENVNVISMGGITPLMAAASFRSFNLVRYLVEDRQADVNISTNNPEYGIENMRSLDVARSRIQQNAERVNQGGYNDQDAELILNLLLARGAISDHQR